MNPPQAVVPMRDFPGLRLDMDAHDMPPGTSVWQVNCTGERLGLLQSRLGLVPVLTESTIALATLGSL